MQRDHALRLSSIVCAAIASSATFAGEPEASAEDFTEMSLEQLMEIDVSRAAGLTEVDFRRLPVDLTHLDSRDIEQSGARDLNQLLEIHVPNLQIIHHHHHSDHVGFRGIISDRDDKYLLQVNGVTMNNRMLHGVDNERGIPLLGDMRSVNVVRGPASATHGAGAVAGVIDIETYNGLNFQGSDVRVRQGFVDKYSAAEYRYGRKLDESSGVFFYYGIADVQGTDSDYFIGKSFAAANGLPANVSGEPYPGPMADLNDSAFDSSRHKFHMSYVNGPIEFWTRFVQDGVETRPQRQIYTGTKPADQRTDEWTQGRQNKNQQFTVAGRYKRDLSTQWKMELLQSYDMWALTDSRASIFIGNPVRHSFEHQLFSRAIFTYTPNESNSIAFGTEYSHMWFENPSQSDALDRAPVIDDRAWQTDTISLFVEDQWKINTELTLFLSFRTDKNTYTDWLVSPRGSLVYTPTEEDTFKFMAGQSVRRGSDEELYAEWTRNGTTPEPEKLLSYELAYERKLSNEWQVAVRGFYEDYEALGWISALGVSDSLGNFQIGGGEIELSYRTPKTRFSISESVSKLIDSSVPDTLPVAGQGITSSPYGFGNDLANWAPSITKLSVIHDLTKQVTVNSSVIYYSGFPGGEDYADFAGSLATPPSGVPLVDAGYTRPFGMNLFVNLGVEYRPDDHWKIRVDGYNLAALIDSSWSKRNYILRTSEYSEEPASIALSVTYSF